MNEQAREQLAAWRKWLFMMSVNGWALTSLGLGSIGCPLEDATKHAFSSSDDEAGARSFAIEPDLDSFIWKLPW